LLTPYVPNGITGYDDDDDDDFITKGFTVFVAVLVMISGQTIGVFHFSPIQG